MKYGYVITLISLFLSFSGNSKSEKSEKKEYSNQATILSSDDNSEIAEDESSTDGGNVVAENTEEENSSGCKIEDGTYSATVDYHNPETGYSQTYTLDVEVQDCQVVEIDFPKGGWLDEDHISPADLDEDGNANVDGEDGKTYDVHIDN